jgi:hypothetical protein
LKLDEEKQKINKLMDIYKIKNFLKRNFDKNYKNKQNNIIINSNE